ncbi:geranylgeranyl reductase family protein [Romeria aff. gracilis LEGE 07310]|uniref:Geranylgeranyl reductase family protein n=1 Tax=Vasconcelosia minhoensis LEGE 07310 TaxID=915328 RepID=A0A8J7A9U0_9CYAN|nr:geranylgeranyl reductase family protein [Romeria gracilis]MBE9078865.1 geranylgeranyl reductase family protein [Romeria aff. gracilis LEGE 07310]
MFDCIIVGAGPAGSSAAYHLAKAGRSVLLLEKADLPRYKPCSGAVSPSIADWFDFDFTPAIDRKMRRIRYTWKLGDPVEAKLKTAEPIWMVQRDVFDQFLVEQAQQQGATLKAGTPVNSIGFQGDAWQVNTATDSYQARYLIAADGATGPMSEWLGFKPGKLRTASLLEAKTEQPLSEADCAINFEFGLVKNGCLWNFPKQQGYSIGVCSFLGGDLKSKDVQSHLDKYAADFNVSLSQGTVYNAALKLWDGNRPLHTQQAVVAGEAAAVVDPLTAEGIRPSMFSGMKAAQAVDQALAGDAEALAGYTQIMQESWGADMQWAQRIAGVFYRVPKMGYRVGIKKPTATERLGQLLAGEIHYADIANKVIKRLSSSLIPGMGG